MPNKNVISETVISLSADIDNSGIQKLLSLLDVNRLKAYTLAGALAAVTTGVYKFIESIVKEERQLKQNNKQKQKSVKLTQEEQLALKTMGKTLEEIKKDDNLKKMYEDVAKFNKELQMPNMKNAMANVNKLQTEFYKLKSAISVALKSIGMQVLTNLEAPMNRISGYMGNAANWIRDKMPQISMKVGTFISDFAKGIIGIAETIGKVVEAFNSLPDSIKGIGLAIAGLAVMLNSGPIGQIIGIITMLGDVIHDAEVYQYNQANGTNIAVAYGGIWEILFGEGTTKDKSRSIAEKVVTSLTDVLTDVTDILAENHTLSGILGGENSVIGQILGGIGQYFDSETGQKQLGGLISTAFGALSQTMSTAGGWGASVVQSLAGMLAQVFNSGDLWNNSELKLALNGDNGIVNGLFGALELSAVGASPLISIIGGLMGGYKTERNKAVEEVYMDAMGWDSKIMAYAKSQGLKLSDMEKYIAGNTQLSGKLSSSTMGNLQADFNQFISGLLETLVGSVTIAGDVAGDLMKTLIHAIIGNDQSTISKTVEDALGQVGEDNPIWNGISTGLTTWLASGNLLLGAITGVGTTLTSAENEQQLKDAADEMVSAWSVIWEGAWVDDAKTEHNGKGLKYWLKQVWEGEDGEGGLQAVFVDLGDKLKTWLEPAFTSIKDMLINTITEAMDDLVLNSPVLTFLFGNKNKMVMGTSEDGSVVVTDKSGNDYTGELASSYTPEAQRFLDYILPYMRIKDGKIDKNVLTTDTGFQYLISPFGEQLRKGMGFSEEEWASFNKSGFTYDGQQAWSWFNLVEQVLAGGAMPGYTKDGKTVEVTLDDILKYLPEGMFPSATPVGGGEEGTGEAAKDSAKGFEKAGKDVQKAGSNAKSGGDSFQSAGSSAKSGGQAAQEGMTMAGDAGSTLAEALDVLREAASSASSELNNVKAPSAAAAMGGRFGSEVNNMTVGEDGTEYIIPITKPQRAFELIRQMFNEMGSSAVARVMSGFGFGEIGTVGSSPASMSSAIQGMTMANTYNISAPVNINVHSDGSDARQIGTSIYDEAERHLIKTLRGVYA